MSLLTQIALSIGAVILVIGSTLVTIAAVFPPKEYKGDGKIPKSGVWDESIEDV
jgi:hypothetical protein